MIIMFMFSVVTNETQGVFELGGMTAHSTDSLSLGPPKIC